MSVQTTSSAMQRLRGSIWGQCLICQPAIKAERLLIAMFAELAYCCLFAGIYQDGDKRHHEEARCPCVCVCVKAHLWLCRAGWWGPPLGSGVCPSTPCRQGFRRRTSGCDRSTAGWCCSSLAYLKPEIADDYPPWGGSITANQSALASGGARHFFFSSICSGKRDIDSNRDGGVCDVRGAGRDSPREKRKGSKPISPSSGTSAMSHCAMLLMETEDDHTGETDFKKVIAAVVSFRYAISYNMILL